MKLVWVRLPDWSEEMVKAALETGADALVIPAGMQGRTKSLGRIVTVASDGDLRPGTDVFFEALSSPEDEARIMGLLDRGTVVIDDEGGTPGPGEPGVAAGRAWEVIPVENLIVHGGKLLLPVRSREEVDLALGIMERGASGVVIHARTPGELRDLITRVKSAGEKAVFAEARITGIRAAGMGDRVCVDTCTLMGEGEGLLTGNSSAFLFLVQAESLANPYVAPRPFRVNAGPVHAYVRVPDEGTRYLSELAAGDRIAVFDRTGSARYATVGRIKIERRPLLFVQAECEGRSGSILLQNAETVRLTTPDGTAKSVVDLAEGDSVLVHSEQAGRHFGKKVSETIREK